MKVTNKDGINEGSERKRKKTSENIPIKLSKEDVYANVINFEENESKQRSSDKDSVLFHQNCEELRKIFDDVAAAKKKNSEHAKQEINTKKIEGSLIFVLLKKLNRLDKIRVRDSREALQKEKLRVDSNRLQLQNLLYEADHLNREIQRCYQFKSQDEEINLISVDEFYETAPESISRPEKTKNDEHARRLARLEWELHKRKELASLYDKLQKNKETIEQDICKKAERIDSLAPRLQSLLKSTRPLQEALELNIEKEWETQKTSKLLSRPLYLLYSNVFAYISAINTKHLKIIINGDEDEAKQIDDFNNVSLQNTMILQDSDQEDNDVEYDLEVANKSYNRRLSKNALLEQRIENLYKAHPLTISISLLNKTNPDNYLEMIFTYLPVLGFVTVKCSLIDQEISGTSGDIVNPETLLNSLLDNDNGDVSPNPKTKYQLSEFKIDNEKFHSTLKEKNYGKSYKWAQTLCGIDFINLTKNSEQNFVLNDLPVNTVPDMMKLIRLRWESRTALQKQIKIFEDDKEFFLLSLKSYRISSKLNQCISITWDDYVFKNRSHKFIEENLVTENDLFYKIILTRGTAKLEAYISIPCDFPKKSTIWTLYLHWNGLHDSNNNSAIRDMEFYINTTMKDLKQVNDILEKQMERALYCLDIYLETECSTINSSEFVQDKTYLKPFRGRNRSRPYKLIENEKCAIFTQIN